MFTMQFWPLSLVCAVGAGAFGWFCLKARGQEDSGGYAIDRHEPPLFGGFCFLVALVSVRNFLYYAMPSFQGAWWGYWDVLGASFLPVATLSLVVTKSWAGRKWAILSIVLFGVWPIVQSCWYEVGPTNGQMRAKLLNVMAAPADAIIPPSDPSQMVMVTQGMAHFRGQSVLGTLGSKYELNQASWTLQAVKGHRYWIAPLTLHNFGDTMNLNNPESPGFVVVDAQDEEAEAVLKKDFHIKLFTDQQWGLYLKRFLYNNGFREGILTAAEFEADDDWQPHFVLSYIKRPFGGMAGEKIEKAIVVNVADVTPTIASYDPNNPAEREKFSWVDRVVPESLVKSYATDWGLWGGEFAKANPWPVWWGFNKTGTMKPDDTEVCYTVGKENVWVVPMTATNSNERSDHTCLGVLVMDTNRNDATYYPGLTGFKVGGSVEHTMFNVRDNVRHNNVGRLQLMAIYGELTWVAIYEAPQRNGGSSFGGIGLLHAHSQNAADVVFATNKRDALSRYKLQLASGHGGSELVSRTVASAAELKGTILRIGPASGTGSLDTQGVTFQFMVEGNLAYVFLVTTNVYQQMPLVREGDKVKFSFIAPLEDVAAGVQIVPVQRFQNLTLDPELPADPEKQ